MKIMFKQVKVTLQQLLGANLEWLTLEESLALAASTSCLTGSKCMMLPFQPGLDVDCAKVDAR